MTKYPFVLYTLSMKILLIGGSGTISSRITQRLYAQEHDVYILNRGKHSEYITNLCAQVRKSEKSFKGKLTHLSADSYNKEELASVTTSVLGLNEQFDTVIDFIAYLPEHVQKDYEIFSGKTKQFIFISSASIYQKPLSNYIITESTPLSNPQWDYSRNKIACEEFLVEKYRTESFPITIIRPSHTYDERSIPLGVHGRNGSWQIVKRMLEQKEVIIHGDGTSLWTMTHAEDFAKGFCALVGNIHAIGEAVQITGDETLTWNQIYECFASALNVPLKAVHVSSHFLAASSDFDLQGSLIGDKANSVVFDNTKLKRLVPGFHSTIRFDEGIKKTIAYLLSHSELQLEDPEFDSWCDAVIAAQKEAINSVLKKMVEEEKT